MIARALGLENLSSSTPLPFNDSSSISSWAVNAISVMYEKGYIDWAGTDSFNPDTPITRAEVVATLVISLIICGGVMVFIAIILMAAL